MDTKNAEQIQDRLRGIAVGAAVGDALGMPLEFQPPRPIHDLETEMVKGQLPAGSFTDDTEMALCLAESLMIQNPLEAVDLAARFTAWYQSSPPDIGIHTTHVLSMIAAGADWQEAASTAQKANPDSSSNGSLMRCWPVAVARHDNPALLVAESRLQSQVTHQHNDCINACIFTNIILAKLVHRAASTPADAALRDAIEDALKKIEIDPEFRLVIELAPVRTRNELNNSGWVRHTLESALWAVLTTRSFEEALVQAVNLGWDADTTGTVAGAIAGAMYGLSSIPLRWKEALHGEYPLHSGKLWFETDFIDLSDNLAAIGN